MSRIEVFFLTLSLLQFVAVLEFVRRRKLLESFALLWLFVGVAGVLVAVFRSSVDSIARFVGVAAGANLFLGMGLLFLLFVSMLLSVYISRLEERVEILAEEVAALRGAAPPFDSDTELPSATP
ncbi:MAG: hypothetical protein QOD92_2564 [Acidimicrobiaceae bacterium]